MNGNEIKIIYDVDVVTSLNLGNDTACIGTFDGMHLGHQELLNKTYIFGDKKYTVVTFIDLPQKTLNDTHYQFLTTNSMKETLINNYRASSIVYFNFLNIRNDDPKTFCTTLYEKYGIKKIVVGNDFRFGKDRSGDISFLIEYFGEKNVLIVSKKKVIGMEVSSSLIREYLSNGEIKTVNMLLGRPYCIEGEVIKGDGLGQKIGFPTANLKIDKNYRIPKKGVYSVKIQIGNLSEIYFGMMNIGVRPTVSNEETIVTEVNIFDFNDNIYDSNLIVDVISFIREEVKFNNLKELKHQLYIDKETSIKKLNSVH